MERSASSKKIPEKFEGGSRIGDKLVYGVAIDGSSMGEKALKTAASLMDMRKDECYMLHVSDSKKTYIQAQMKPETLREAYSTKAIECHISKKDQALFIIKDKRGEKNTAEVLEELAEEHRVDFLVIGAFGRKGAKLDAGALGSVADSLLHTIKSSVCIVKPSSKHVEANRVFLLAADGSAACHAAFTYIVHRVYRPGDKLICVYASDIVSHTTVLDQYEVAMKAAAVDGEVKFLPVPGKAIDEALVEYAESREADFIVIGISGYGHQAAASNKRLGSVSEGVAVRARCTVLVVKDVWHA